MGEVTKYMTLGLEPRRRMARACTSPTLQTRCRCMIPSGIERKSSALAATLDGAESS
jgi:hypothetical protein